MSGVVCRRVLGGRLGFEVSVGVGVLVSGLLLRAIFFRIRLNMGLCMSVYVSFICNLCALRFCM
jgi:hypothetical protein